MAISAKVATNIPQWATMMQRRLGISDTDPKKNDKIWRADASSWRFSSGSDLSEEDYLRLRVIWHHWTNLNDFKHYMRDNPALVEGGSETGPHYTGYVTKENDQLATQIYEKLEPSFRGYLNHIRSRKDATRPGSGCGSYFFARYYQGMVMAKTKSKYTAAEEAALPSNIRKRIASVNDDSNDDAASANAVLASTAATSISERPTASMAETSVPGSPKTPPKQVPQARPQMETPTVPRSFPATGGSQNPPTSDETYVNMALLLLLQALTLDMAELGKSLHDRLDFGDLEWLADRLPLKLYRRRSGSEPLELMEARVDGYLCKRDYEPPTATAPFHRASTTCP